jgi:hypothetical protein
VDESPAMLARVPDLPTTCAHIQTVEVEYHVGERVWTHARGSYQIGEQELLDDLAAAGLRFGRWLTGDHACFTAHPTP